MFSPIHRQLLTDTVTVEVCTGKDAWGNVAYALHTVRHVHLQNTNELRKTKDNTEVVLRSILFIDARLSTPSLNYDALVRASEAAGAQMRVIVGSNDYAVMTVDPVPDDRGGIHHTELGLV